MLDILVIDNISGDGTTFEISVKTKNNESYKLIFDGVCDLQSTIELANVLRFEHIDDFLKDNSVFVVEKSERIKKYTESGLEDIQGKLVHYVVMDDMDTVIDIICTSEPMIHKLEGSEIEDLLEKQVEQLKWWDNNENILVIQKELDELRAYKSKREKEDKKAREDEINANSFGF